MTFILQNFVPQTVSLNSGQTEINSVEVGGPALFSYANPADTIATIAGANYFSQVAFDLSPKDVLFLTGSDASGMYEVDTVDRTVNPPTVTIVSYGPTAAIGTANLVDGAVTAAKLASDAVETAKILNNNVTSAKLATNVVQYAAVAVSSAEFKGMYVTPKQLVAAGGANTLLVLDKVDLLMTYGSAAYAGGGVAHVQYGNTTLGAGVIASTTLAAATFQPTASTGFMFNTGVVAQTFTTCVNLGLFLSNITGAFTTGDSDFVAHCWYKVIPTV